jgi:hypothetical protein
MRAVLQGGGRLGGRISAKRQKRASAKLAKAALRTRQNDKASRARVCFLPACQSDKAEK